MNQIPPGIKKWPIYTLSQKVTEIPWKLNKNQSTLEPKNDQKYSLSLKKKPKYPQKQKTTKYPLSIQMFYTHTSLA